jgi:hypothetical protein
MNLTEAEKFCNDWLPAWSGNDPEKLMSFYSSDSFYSDPSVKKGLNGHEEILPYFKDLLNKNPHWRWYYKELFPSDKGFIVKWETVIPVGENRIIEYGMDIVEIDNNHITRNEVYFDTHNLISAIKKQNQQS